MLHCPAWTVDSAQLSGGTMYMRWTGRRSLGLSCYDKLQSFFQQMCETERKEEQGGNRGGEREAGDRRDGDGDVPAARRYTSCLLQWSAGTRKTKQCSRRGEAEHCVNCDGPVPVTITTLTATTTRSASRFWEGP
jgi:hypothetical protein